MPRASSYQPPNAADLAARLVDALASERTVPRFVDSYVVENGRHALQVHAPLYRDLLTILQREALLAVAVSALDLVCSGQSAEPKPAPLTRKDAALFRRKFLAALARTQNWNAGEALDFQNDLQIYEDVLARGSSPHRSRKPFEAAHHPFVDRCAFLLDSSFMEKARIAASRALTAIEELAAAMIEQVLKDTRPRIS
jgi:hypothetical protein